MAFPNNNLLNNHFCAHAQDDGVSKWSVVYPVGNGPRQSPIDIQSGRAVLDDKLKWVYTKANTWFAIFILFLFNFKNFVILMVFS